ncbi:hypothetical protein DYB32_010615, partial [Aphanomyces invadans]
MPISNGVPPSAPKYEQVMTPSEGVVPASSDNPGDAPTSAPHVSADEQQEREETAEDLMHGINSFWAVVWPVVAVVNCRSRALERSMGSYLVYNEVQGADAGQVVGHSLVNALVVIGFVTGLTFFMALLYKFNCMRILVGYIMFSSSAILGFVGGQLVDTVNDTYLHWPIDWVSFLFIMVNFSFVGVVAIFYQKPFDVHDCATEDEFKALLFAFYARYSPDDTWKVDQVAARFFANQPRMWPSLFHKYMVCSCGTDGVPCSVQIAIDLRNQ